MQLRDVCSLILGILGVIFILFGLIFGLSWSDLFHSILHSEMVLSPTSKSYEHWKQPPIALPFDIYLYNWTNHEEFKINGTKPILQELGPYRFIEKPNKTNVTWNADNSTVSFGRMSHFYFDAEGSNGSLTDVITSLNIVALAASNRARHWNYMSKRAVSMGFMIYGQQIHITKTVDELLFIGYEDDLINMAKDMPMFGQEKIEVPFDRFGWFYTRNGTDRIMGHFNMYTGEGDINKIGKMGEWNYSNRTSYFPDHCGMVNGSAGEFYPPNQTKNKPISFFSPDMCRTIPLDFEEESIVHNMMGYKYTGGPKTVDNGSVYPDNWCFSTGDIVPSGVLNISACRHNTPVFMSFPHYYGADPYYLNMVEGLNPIKEKHQFYMTLDPKTGIPLDVAARFQVNMLVQQVPDIELYKDVPYIFFPVLWFEQKVTIPEEMVNELMIAHLMPKAGQIVSVIIAIIGLLMCTCYGINYYLRNRRRKIADKNKILYKNCALNEKSEKSEKLPEGSPLIHKINLNEQNSSNQQKNSTKPEYLYPQLDRNHENGNQS